MKMDFKISFIEKEKMDSIFLLLSKLNPKISSDVLKSRLKNMILQGYQCVGVFDKDKLVGISSIWVLTKYNVGQHIETDNVFILPEYQGKGIGKRLIDWIFDYAKFIGCLASELNCYIENKAGQRFWKQQGYEVVAYHFQKKLR